MKLAVVQHARRATVAEDLEALLQSAVRACSLDADVVVLPRPIWLDPVRIAQIPEASELSTAFPDVTVLSGPLGVEAETSAAGGVRLVRTPLGMTAALYGDDCLDPLMARELVSAEPDAIILRPGSESDLQAEAVLELALGLSESTSGLVLIAEADGAEAGEPGHGGSAIITLGALSAEALSGDDLLLSDVLAPVPQPEPRDPLPQLPPILTQRLALHRGERVQVDYPADLS